MTPTVCWPTSELLALSGLLGQVSTTASAALLVGLVLAALGFCLAIPYTRRSLAVAGLLLALVGMGVMAGAVTAERPLGDWLYWLVFWALALTTLLSAAAAVAMRSALYAAVWFALTLLSTAGLFLLEGAQFLGVATVVVYAGAIVVTFLFVIMLAQPRGHEAYDRLSWGGFPKAVAVFSGAFVVAALAYALSTTALPAATGPREVLVEQHMAALGGELFVRHLISVEVGGVLLLVALVGAIAIAMQGKQQESYTHE